MIEVQEKALILLNQRHVKLVELLKKALFMGQIGFLKAAEILWVIKENETYKGEDASYETSWTEFCARQDLPIPGRTISSRKRTADAWVRIYRVFREQLEASREEFARIGWTKLDLIAPVCEALEGKKEEIRDWIDRAKLLTVNDLIVEVKGKGYDPICDHENAYQKWYCPTCGLVVKEDPRKIKRLKEV